MVHWSGIGRYVSGQAWSRSIVLLFPPFFVLFLASFFLIRRLFPVIPFILDSFRLHATIFCRDFLAIRVFPFSGLTCSQLAAHFRLSIYPYSIITICQRAKKISTFFLHPRQLLTLWDNNRLYASRKTPHLFIHAWSSPLDHLGFICFYSYSLYSHFVTSSYFFAS